MSEVASRLGMEQFITPREIVRDFVAVLNILQQNPNQNFDAIVGGGDFSVSKPVLDPEALTAETEIQDEEPPSPYANFKI